jgi:hypothetical protein
MLDKLKLTVEIIVPTMLNHVVPFSNKLVETKMLSVLMTKPTMHQELFVTTVSTTELNVALMLPKLASTKVSFVDQTTKLLITQTLLAEMSA